MTYIVTYRFIGVKFYRVLFTFLFVVLYPPFFQQQKKNYCVYFLSLALALNFNKNCFESLNRK